MCRTTLVAVVWRIIRTRITIIIIIQLVQVPRLGNHLMRCWLSILKRKLVTAWQGHRAAVRIVPQRMIIDETGATSQHGKCGTARRTLCGVHVVVHAAASGQTLVAVGVVIIIVVIVVNLVYVEARHSHVCGPPERFLGDGRRNRFNNRLVRTRPCANTSGPNDHLFPFLSRVHPTRCLRGRSIWGRRRTTLVGGRIGAWS